MSTTITQKQPKQPKQPSWLSRLLATLGLLDAAKAAVEKGEAEYGTVSVQIGRLLVEKHGKYGAEWYSKESNRESVVSQLATVGMSGGQQRTGLGDKPFTWGYVYSWIKAATIEIAIIESRPDLAERLSAFTADSLGKVAMVESKADLETAVAFAVERLDKGETSNRAVRAAYDKAYPKPERSEPAVAKLAAKAETQLKGTEIAANRQLAKLQLAPSAIMTVLQFAALVGMTTRDAEVSAAVLRDMLKTPVAKAAKK